MNAPLWTPSAERIAATRMDAFRRFVNQRHGLQLADYPALHAWSVNEREAFWQAYLALKRRIDLLLALPLASLDELSLAERLRAIGKTADEEAALG